jgi:hypothetical protein
MNLAKSSLLLLVLLLFASVSSLLVSAYSSSPVIDSVTVINSGAYTIFEIRGHNFGHDPNAVQLVMNDNGVFGEVLKVKAKKIVAQLPNSDLCNGAVTLRALVKRIPSNATTVDLRAGAPALDNLAPLHAQPGSVVEIRGINFACQTAQNLVSFNNLSAEVLAIGRNSLSVRVPEVTPGAVQVRVNVAGQLSQGINFVVDPKVPGSGNGTPIQFAEASGVPGAAGFAPMFSVNENILFEGEENSLWDAAFSGKHQAVILAPWKTITGEQQVAMLTLVCLHSNSLAGNNTGQFEKFVYVRINYPMEPHKPYNPETNPFWWGASGLATEHYPQGGIYYNSISRAMGGVDSFLMARAVPGKAKLTATMKVIAPDLFKYEQYGENYEKAGNGIVFMPKVATVRFEFDQIDMQYPIARVNLGSVILIDESGANGGVRTDGVRFRSSILDPGEIDPLTK